MSIIDVSCLFFFKQKTAYEMRISDWSSDVCSSDLDMERRDGHRFGGVDTDGLPILVAVVVFEPVLEPRPRLQEEVLVSGHLIYVGLRVPHAPRQCHQRDRKSAV